MRHIYRHARSEDCVQTHPIVCVFLLCAGESCLSVSHDSGLTLSSSDRGEIQTQLEEEIIPPVGFSSAIQLNTLKNTSVLTLGVCCGL